MKEKVILIDCDGVVLDWMYAFRQWMNRHGYKEVNPNLYEVDRIFNIPRPEAKKLCRMFNESAWIRKLPPLGDAIKYVRKLHEEHGYVFHAITSLSNDEYAQHLRTKNLCELFGPSAIERYVYLDTGADKDEALAEYVNTGCMWVEDKPENARVGKNLGLNAHLMAWGYNQGVEDIPRVQNWKEIYEILTG